MTIHSASSVCCQNARVSFGRHYIDISRQRAKSPASVSVVGHTLAISCFFRYAKIAFTGLRSKTCGGRNAMAIWPLWASSHWRTWRLF